jgi:metallophosphoesterase (TIGR03768 family)
MLFIKPNIIPIITLSILPLLPVSGSGAELGTRQQTICPVAIRTNTLQIPPNAVSNYAVYGYSAWQWSAGTNQGRQFLPPSSDTGATNVARLLSFFSMSDVHLADKESPAQMIFFGWNLPYGVANGAAYSPVLLSTTHVLDAAVKTVNAWHRLTPFDFGICLGDVAHNNQYNELRWFIDVMDGTNIVPSSGAHLGATNIDYQKPYQATGLDRSIPWYQVIGNHDQFWMGSGYPTEKIRNTLVGSNVLNMANLFANPLVPNPSEGTGVYVGVIDGTTPYGDVIMDGTTNTLTTARTVVADPDRRALTTDYSSTTNYMSEFFKTASFPVGHGFKPSNIASNSACYTFEPLTNLPLKVIVLDDMPKTNILNPTASYGSLGQIDAARLAWLTNELQLGQDADQLMIIATHVPISPQADLFNTNRAAQQFYDPQAETNLIATLHHYSNLILLMAGHRHISTVTPQPSPDPAHPEYGFWEVETPSLRDFPQQFRTWEILRNSDHSISILTTDVDPVVEPNTPAGNSRGYAIGIARIAGVIASNDTTSHTYNAELVKTLSAKMQAKIAGYGGPLGHHLAIDRDGTGAVINFLGELQSADNLLGPWTYVTDTSPYAVSAANAAKFYRAVE